MSAFASIAATVITVLLLWIWIGAWGRARDPQAHARASTLPVLGGRPPALHAWHRVHLRYYPMALLLLAFEMEMMFMYPWAVAYVREGTIALAEMGMFLGLLSVGIAYAWREGALRWQ